MPNESLSQGKKTNRREFLKAAAGVAGAFAAEGVAGAQENFFIDNAFEELVVSRQKDKINFPDKFKIITPEVEDVLYSMQKYNEVVSGGNVISSSLENSALQFQPVSSLASEDSVATSRRTLFAKLRKMDIGLGEYSDELFFKTLAYETPKLLADYGIYMWPNYLLVSQNDNAGNPVSFLQNHILIYLSQITRIRRDDVKQGGISVHRDILHAQNFQLFGKDIGFKTTGLAAQTYFGNIVIFDNRLDAQVAGLTQLLGNIEKQVQRYPAGGFIKAMQSDLEQSNQWSNAAQIVMAKLAGKIKKKIDHQQTEEETLAHETRHLVDQKTIDFKKFFPFIKTTSPKENNKRSNNHGAHEEINPIITQLIHSPNRELTLLNFISLTRDAAAPEAGVYSLAYKWILRKMIEFISKNPGKYGIKINLDSKVNTVNQILTQMDVLLDNTELFDDLCHEVMEYHNKNLNEYIQNNLKQPEVAGSGRSDKIDIPSLIIGTGLVLEQKLRRSKNQARKAAMTRQQIRAEERGKAKKK